MKLFGTDGIRGVANDGVITPEYITKIATVAGHLFTKNDNYKHSVVIGKDTRLSGYMIESALVAGFLSVGMDVTLLGPLPTPAVSMLTRSLRADLGVMISASHNPSEDNGIKFFGPNGFKLNQEIEKEIEGLVHENQLNLVNGNNLGMVTRLSGAQERYIEYIKNTINKKINFQGLKIVVDCANGAAYQVAPQALWELGAEVIPIAIEPNGININQNCGTLHSEYLSQAVIENKADIGIVLDGDADRIIISDEKGQIVDGDQIIALLAQHWHKNKMLKNPTIVGTVMSNMGLENFIKNLGMQFVRSPVGDKFVSEMMRKYNANIGGESSGHIILSDFHCTGDGLLAGLQVISILLSSQSKASKLLHCFNPINQVLLNYKVVNKKIVQSESLKQKIQEIEQYLSSNGRIVVRASGTENIIRVMIEDDLPKLKLESYAHKLGDYLSMQN